MKTFILTLSIVGCISAAKAQKVTAKLLPSLKVPAWQQSFDKQLALGDIKPLLPEPKTAASASSEPRQLVAIEITDRMPVAKPIVTDKAMPIIKTDRTAYNMPVVGKKPVINNADNATQPRY